MITDFPDRYKYFIILHVAMRIVIRPELCNKYNNYANYLLQLFVEKCEQVYSKLFYVYNIQYLLHIADDAEI